MLITLLVRGNFSKYTFLNLWEFQTCLQCVLIRFTHLLISPKSSPRSSTQRAEFTFGQLSYLKTQKVKIYYNNWNIKLKTTEDHYTTEKTFIQKSKVHLWWQKFKQLLFLFVFYFCFCFSSVTAPETVISRKSVLIPM